MDLFIYCSGVHRCYVVITLHNYLQGVARNRLFSCEPNGFHDESGVVLSLWCILASEEGVKDSRHESYPDEALRLFFLSAACPSTQACSRGGETLLQKFSPLPPFLEDQKLPLR